MNLAQFGSHDGRLVEDAYNIAWDYLTRSGQVYDAAVARMMLSKELSRLILQGERNALRLANKAISAYEHYFLDI